MVEVDEGVNASGALLVSCFPSVGFVSSIVAHYLVDKLELELVGASGTPTFLLCAWSKTASPYHPSDSMQASRFATWRSATRSS